MPRSYNRPDKWARNAIASYQEWRDGVQNTSKDWHGAVTGAAALARYTAGVQNPDAAVRMRAGIQAVSDAQFIAAITNYGVSNYIAGVQRGIPKYAIRFLPYAATLAGINYPARGLPNSPENIARRDLVFDTLRGVKVRGVTGATFDYAGVRVNFQPGAGPIDEPAAVTALGGTPGG